MKLTLGQVARELEMNKATLSRYIKQGKISAEKQEDGSYRIDPSEIDRLRATVLATVKVTHDRQPVVPVPEIGLLRELLAEKDKQIDNLTQERDEWREQCRSCISTLRINIPRSFRARASSCRSCRLPVPASDICGVPGVVQGCRALHDGSSTTGAATMRQAKRQMLWCCHAGCLVWSTRLHETVAACASPEAWHPW